MSQVKILNDYLIPDITNIIMDYNMPEVERNDFKDQIWFCFAYAKKQLMSENRTEAKYFDLLRIIRQRVRKWEWKYSMCINFFKSAELLRNGFDESFINKYCDYILRKITEKEKKLIYDLWQSE